MNAPNIHEAMYQCEVAMHWLECKRQAPDRAKKFHAAVAIQKALAALRGERRPAVASGGRERSAT